MKQAQSALGSWTIFQLCASCAAEDFSEACDMTFVRFWTQGLKMTFPYSGISEKNKDMHLTVVKFEFPALFSAQLTYFQSNQVTIPSFRHDFGF